VRKCTVTAGHRGSPNIPHSGEVSLGQIFVPVGGPEKEGFAQSHRFLTTSTTRGRPIARLRITARRTLVAALKVRTTLPRASNSRMRAVSRRLQLAPADPVVRHGKRRVAAGEREFDALTPGRCCSLPSSAAQPQVAPTPVSRRMIATAVALRGSTRFVCEPTALERSFGSVNRTPHRAVACVAVELTRSGRDGAALRHS
jgi:hypothetical protein